MSDEPAGDDLSPCSLIEIRWPQPFYHDKVRPISKRIVQCCTATNVAVFGEYSQRPNKDMLTLGGTRRRRNEVPFFVKKSFFFGRATSIFSSQLQRLPFAAMRFLDIPNVKDAVYGRKSQTITDCADTAMRTII